LLSRLVRSVHGSVTSAAVHRLPSSRWTKDGQVRLLTLILGKIGPLQF
jgi:hypothetical protein